MMKLYWRVQPAPTGPFRSFMNRGWPRLFLQTGHKPDQDVDPMVARLRTDPYEDYTPELAKHGTELNLRVYFHSYVRNSKLRSVKVFPTLTEAKAEAERIVRTHPGTIPERYRQQTGGGDV